MLYRAINGEIGEIACYKLMNADGDDFVVFNINSCLYYNFSVL